MLFSWVFVYINSLTSNGSSKLGRKGWWKIAGRQLPPNEVKECGENSPTRILS